MEADQTLFQAIFEMELGEPYDALPNALKLRRENTLKAWGMPKPQSG
jgi:hypothetical protein